MNLTTMMLGGVPAALATGLPGRSRLLPDALVARLREFRSQRDAPCAFRPGDLVTPRADGIYSPHGEPYLVLEVLPSDRAFEPEPGTRNAAGGEVLDLRVAFAQHDGSGDVVMMVDVVPHYRVQPWTVELCEAARRGGASSGADGLESPNPPLTEADFDRMLDEVVGEVAEAATVENPYAAFAPPETGSTADVAAQAVYALVGEVHERSCRMMGDEDPRPLPPWDGENYTRAMADAVRVARVVLEVGAADPRPGEALGAAIGGTSDALLSRVLELPRLSVDDDVEDPSMEETLDGDYLRRDDVLGLFAEPVGPSTEGAE